MSAPSKEEFYQSLNADTWCGWDWCRKLYGYQIADPAFLERVFARLDELKRGRVKTIYGFYYKTQRAYEIEQERDAGAWLVDKTHRDYKKEVREWQKKVKSMTKPELTELCKQFLSRGIISSPEQFATAVGLDQ